MNNAGGQPQHGQPGQAGQPQPPRPPPMYQPAQIRSLPLLSEEEKVKYEHGVTGLWTRMNNSPPNSQEHLAARNKIIEFSRMLISKIQSRRNQAQQQQGQQGAATGGQATGAAQPQTTTAQPKAPQQPAAPPSGISATNTNGATTTTASATAASTASAAAAALTRPKVPDHLMAHVNKMTFKPPQHLAGKNPADAAKWIEEMKERYGRALMTMESAKAKVASMDKVFQDRAHSGNPLKDEELRQYRLRREQHLKLHNDGQKWVETVRKQQEGIQSVAAQAAQAQAQNTAAAQNKANGAAAAAATQQSQTAAAPVNAGAEAVKNQQQQRQTPVTAQQQQQQQQARLAAQNAASTAVKQEPQQPAPVNTALANAQAQTPAQGAARVGTPQGVTAAVAGGPTRALSHSAAMSLANQRAAAQPANAAIANQQQQQQQQHQAAQQAPLQQQQQPQAAVTPISSTPGATNNSAINAATQQQQQQQGHPHAHPPQQPPASLQSKMPIQKQLPERATAVPQGVTLGGGVAAGRPTLSQGGGTLGGVMNQPAMAKIPAYSHDAEGDHVLSKKKLDELVRQVCGAPAEGSSDGNLLTPEVEEVSFYLDNEFSGRRHSLFANKCFPLLPIERPEYG